VTSPVADALYLTDTQLQMVQELARPLRHWQRTKFLQALARHLEGKEVGDGSVHRAALDAQREVLNGSKHDVA
jgi:hypothetical protein